MYNHHSKEHSLSTASLPPLLERIKVLTFFERSVKVSKRQNAFLPFVVGSASIDEVGPTFPVFP